MFAVIGAVPFGLTLLVRMPSLRAWAAAETSALLRRELGVVASFRVTLETWPFAVVLSNVVVESTDGGDAALRVGQIVVRPRLFSLLAGRLDAGQIEIDHPEARVVVQNGEVQNLSLQLPKGDGSTPPRDVPFTSVAITNASVDLDWDGTRFDVRDLDLDVSAERGPSFEIALRAGKQLIDRRRPNFLGEEPSEPVIDEDAVCQLDARVRVTPWGILVRRLLLQGAADLDGKRGTRPPCGVGANDPRKVEVELSHVQVRWQHGGPPDIDGSVHVRAPVDLTNRFVPFAPLHGWIAADLEGQYGHTGTLPRIRGTVRAHGFELERYHLASDLAADISIEDDVIRSDRATIGFGDGTVIANKLSIEPLKKGVPMRVAVVDSSNVRFSSIMRDMGVTPHAHVSWLARATHVSPFEGTLSPLRLEGDFTVATNDFEVFDKGFDDPARRHMIGVREARIGGRLQVRSDSVVFRNTRVDFGGSHLETTVTLGFHDDIGISVVPGSYVDLADISPLANLRMGGKATLGVEMAGSYSDPVLLGNLAVQGLSLHGFPLGDVVSKVRFAPLTVDFTEAKAKKGRSSFDIPSARLDFNGPASLRADAVVHSNDMYLRDFFHMWHFDTDPRFEGLEAHGGVHASVRYDLGGPADVCGGGALVVRGAAHFDSADLFDEHYDGADSEFAYSWADPDASSLGLDIDVRSLTLRKGRGSIFGSATVRRGGLVRGTLAANDIPLSHLQAVGSLGRLMDGTVSATGVIGGTLDQLEADIDARMGPIRIGSATLPPSQMHVALVPRAKAATPIGKTRCGQPIYGPFDRAEYDRDVVDGAFHASGRLFDGQVAFNDLQITRQRNKTTSGQVRLTGLRLEPFAQLQSVGQSGAGARDTYGGELTGVLDIRSFVQSAPERTNATLSLQQFSAGASWGRVNLEGDPVQVAIGNDRLFVSPVKLKLAAGAGFEGRVVLQGEVRHLSGARDLDLSASLEPAPLSELTTLFPRIERASGTMQANIQVHGTASRPAYAGEAHISNGELSLHGLSLPISNLDLDLGIMGDELRITRGQAMVGGGPVFVAGRMPIHGFRFGDGSAVIMAKRIHIPVADGMALTCDADLRIELQERENEDEQNLPKVSGNIVLTSFTYSRPINISADLGSLTQRTRRKSFESYDPNDDFVEFDVRLTSREPLRLINNLIDAQLVLDSDALVFSGTNQRFGLRGRLRLVQGGRIRLRANEFEVRQGYVAFDDPYRIAPNVDVTAVTEYRRYSSSTSAQSSSGASSGSLGAAAGAGATGAGRTGGSYRITLHANGDTDSLKLDMTSEPVLSQEDIVLLLTMGLTRAELDQLQAANLGGNAALEALSQLTGADAVVRRAVPVIDDFRFGTAYSSKTGGTQPTVTMSKRLTNDVKANVTTGLSDNREIRSNVEVRLTPHVSVQGSYDNVNDVSSSSLGNLGADVRYRLEFE